MSSQATTIDLLALPEEMATAISLLPGFESQSGNVWQEEDPEEFPSVGASQYGYVDDVQVSVAQIRSGGTQLTFALDHPIDPEDYTAAVSWFYPPFGEVDFASNSVAQPVEFRIQGDYQAILAHETLLRLIRQVNDLLDNMLLEDAKDIIASTIQDVVGNPSVQVSTCLSRDESRRFFFDFYTRLANVE